MKKLLTILTSLPIVLSAHAQTYSLKYHGGATQKYSIKRKITNNTKISFTTFSIPFTFLRLENNKITTPIAAGLSYLYVSGDAKANEDNTVTVEPIWFAGIYSDYGINQLKNIEPSLTVGGCVGLDKIALLAGYNLSSKQPILGISYKIEGFQFVRNTAKFFRPKNKK